MLRRARRDSLRFRRSIAAKSKVQSGNVEMRHKALVQDWRAEVDGWWADVLHVPAAAVRAGGVFALDHVDHVGVVAVDGAAAPVAYGPTRVLPAVQATARVGRGDLVDGADLAAALAPLVSRVLGPAWYGYATAQTLGPPAGEAVRPLRER